MNMFNTCINNELIEVVGLCDTDSFDLESYPYWTQISVPENLLVPELKPDIEQINAVSVGVEIYRTRVIITPTSIGENLEGKLLWGRKLIVEGGVTQAISYTAVVADGSQPMHTAHFAVPFSAYIVLPSQIPSEGNADPLGLEFKVLPCIEDVFIKEVCPRQIFKNVTLLLQAIPLGPVSNCL